MSNKKYHQYRFCITHEYPCFPVTSRLLSLTLKSLFLPSYIELVTIEKTPMNLLVSRDLAKIEYLFQDIWDILRMYK